MEEFRNNKYAPSRQRTFGDGQMTKHGGAKNQSGIYSLNSPRRLFEKLARSFAAFCESPTEDGIFEIIFPLYHLREWICPGGHEAYRSKPEGDRTREEILHTHLHVMPEYEVARSLCNAVKHYNDGTLSDRTEVLEGMRAGLGRAGDSLGVTHFTVDDRDIRDFFWPVYEVYVAYFREA